MLNSATVNMNSSKIHLMSCMLLALVSQSLGDIYLHNPRGSNNRLDEKSRNRANANSLFDSQNNNRGGYNVGTSPMFYYQGSILPIEWTNQHSCGNQNSNCEIVLQYMCGDNVRDGTTTQTIPKNRDSCKNENCNTDRRFRMHESYEYYQHCASRARNTGLYTADQQVRTRTARGTRQNRKGKRRGYECPEERDYYPYWQPTPWVDIAVLTNDVSRCDYYRRESQNVKSRWACVFPPAVMAKAEGRIRLPSNREDCERFRLSRRISLSGTGSSSRTPTWQEFPAFGVPAPECRATQWTRDNHLGNTLGGNTPVFNWTIPTHMEHENCVLRARYNISTSDYDPWATFSEANNEPKGEGVSIAAKLGFQTDAAASARGFVFENDPKVKVFDDVSLDLQLALDTAQFGRTFQDRTHTFAVRPVPQGLTEAGATIRNLNVRGKRGNIVQVYPAVEYDFAPNTLEMASGDYVHIQWTGSDNNPRNNDGQGEAGTDRSNIILLDQQVYSEFNGNVDYQGGKYGHYGRNYPMHTSNGTFLGLPIEDAIKLAYSDQDVSAVYPDSCVTGRQTSECRQLLKEFSELDGADAYFNLPPRQITQPGTYHYMSTRNNNFSNRDQKGRIVVSQ